MNKIDFISLIDE